MSKSVGITYGSRYAHAVLSFVQRLWAMVRSVMIASSEQVLAWLQQATKEGSKSSALNPLLWALGIVSTSLLGCLGVNQVLAGKPPVTGQSSPVAVPGWLTIGLFAVFCVLIVAILLAYGFLLFVDRDALRSERYGLTKLMIQGGGLKGDDTVGLMEDAIDVTPKSLVAPDAGGGTEAAS